MRLKEQMTFTGNCWAMIHGIPQWFTTTVNSWQQHKSAVIDAKSYLLQVVVLAAETKPPWRSSGDVWYITVNRSFPMQNPMDQYGLWQSQWTRQLNTNPPHINQERRQSSSLYPQFVVGYTSATSLVVAAARHSRSRSFSNIMRCRAALPLRNRQLI